MKFDTSKVSERNVFENNDLRVRKNNGSEWDVSQGNFNLKNGKYVIELKYGPKFDC